LLTAISVVDGAGAIAAFLAASMRAMMAERFSLICSGVMLHRRLASAAHRLTAAARMALPPLALMTDDDRLPNPLAAAAALPFGSLVVVRARRAERRERLARALLALARTRHLLVLIAGDPALAARLGADGLHLPEARACEAAHWRARHPAWLISAARHRPGPVPPQLDFVFLSPVFPTRSHPDRPALGPARANLMARALPVPAYALGGVDARNAPLLSGFAGLAAIGALAA
jgi:thiamine-phosphate pyrophosphorylase